MLNLIFQGAAQTTTGSMHVVEFKGKRILLDCGLLQGKRKESFEANRCFPFPAQQIDAIVLSHAHIDHCGRIPALVRQGYRGPIYATPATCELAGVLLHDSAFLQERDVEFVNKRRAKQGKVLFELLYDELDVEATKALFEPVPYGQTQQIAPGLNLTFTDAGHILGSATCALDYLKDGKPRRVLFTGDLGQKDTPFLANPVVVPDVDVLITESTYGDRNHPTRENIRGRLKDYLGFIRQHRSKLIIPAFSVGRTQQVLYFINDLIEHGVVPPTPIYVDSPLSKKATAIHENHLECFNAQTQALLAKGDDPFKFPGLRFTGSVDESKGLNEKDGPMVIISASGMCEGGRILHHLRNNIDDPRNVILITGYQAEHTLGRRIIDEYESDERVKTVRIYGEEREIRATVYTINGLSAHADSRGLTEFASACNPERVFCVHGEPRYCIAHKKSLLAAGIDRVDIPVQGQHFENV